MRQRLRYLLSAYVLTVLLFIIAKIVFVLCCGKGHAIDASDLPAILLHGLSLDLSTALYVMAVPLVLCLVDVWVTIPRKVLVAYHFFISLALALAFVADTSLYPFWGFKLDASCLQYLSQPEGITQSVSMWYLIGRGLLLLGLAIIFFFLYKLTLPKKDVSRTTKQRRLIESLVWLALMPLMVIGIRGGLGESTTNIGQVYFSQNQFLNHAAVNPVFSFLYSLAHQLGDLSAYDFFSDDECQQLTAQVYNTESNDNDTLLTTTRPSTIVIILLESAGEEFAHVMPHLQQLKQEGVYFSQCYGNTWRTDRGTVCALSGYPSFPAISVMKMPEKSRTLPSIARTLQKQGYATNYLYGGDINFTNMRSYLIATGWEHLTSQDDYTAAQQHSAKWGVRDDITFQTLEQRILKSHDASQPLLIGYSTLSSHEPWDVPLQRHDDEILNAFAYLDDCLFSFIENMRKSSVWDDLLVILTADHGINYKHIDQSTPLEKNHIPMLWLGGAIKEPRSFDMICNQSDLAATLLGQLRLPHDDFSFSRDVLSSTYAYPTAVHNYNNAQWIADSTGHVLYDFTTNRFIVEESTDAQRLLQVSKAILQRTTDDLKNR